MNAKILVIEDSQKHVVDVKNFFSEVAKSAKVQASYVNNFKDACSKIAQADGIIADIFFPIAAGQQPEQNGFKVGILAKRKNIPIVFCSDLNLHSDAHHILRVIREEYEQEGYYLREWDKTGGKKLWAEAYVGLTYLMEVKRLGSPPDYRFINLSGLSLIFDKERYDDGEILKLITEKDIFGCQPHLCDPAFVSAREKYWQATIFRRLWLDKKR